MNYYEHEYLRHPLVDILADISVEFQPLLSENRSTYQLIVDISADISTDAIDQYIDWYLTLNFTNISTDTR